MKSKIFALFAIPLVASLLFLNFVSQNPTSADNPSLCPPGYKIVYDQDIIGQTYTRCVLTSALPISTSTPKLPTPTSTPSQKPTPKTTESPDVCVELQKKLEILIAWYNVLQQAELSNEPAPKPAPDIIVYIRDIKADPAQYKGNIRKAMDRAYAEQLSVEQRGKRAKCIGFEESGSDVSTQPTRPPSPDSDTTDDSSDCGFKAGKLANDTFKLNDKVAFLYDEHNYYPRVWDGLNRISTIKEEIATINTKLYNLSIWHPWQIAELRAQRLKLRTELKIVQWKLPGNLEKEHQIRARWQTYYRSVYNSLVSQSSSLRNQGCDPWQAMASSDLYDIGQSLTKTLFKPNISVDISGSL